MTEWRAVSVDANGTTLRCYRTGDPAGPPIVLLHGFYDNAACWTPLVRDLEAEFDLTLYDARGHGESAAPESGYAIEDRIGDLAGVVDAFDLDSPALIGHSMGGSTAAWAAAMRPGLTRGIVLEDPAGMYDEPERGPDERAEFVEERVREWGERSVGEHEAEYDHLDSDLATALGRARVEVRPQIREIAREGYPHLADAFPDIDCPALVLRADRGTEKRIVDLDVADDLPDGRLVHVPDAGHTILRDEYDAAYAEIRTFLERHERG